MSADDHDAQSPPPQGFGDIAATIGARNLLIAIVTMPIFALLAVWAIIAAFGKPGGKDAPVEAAATPPAHSAAAAPIALREGETIRSVTLDGDRIAATVDGPDGAVIVIYDIARGEEIARVPVTPEETVTAE